MKRNTKLVVIASCLVLSLAAYAAHTTEVLVLTTATLMVRNTDTSAVEIVNLGPNTIWCGIGPSSAAVINKSRPVLTGEAWSIDLPAVIPIYCITSVNQVTGAASIVSETKR